MPQASVKKDSSKKLNMIKTEVNFKGPVLYESRRRFFKILSPGAAGF
jgi:hypothetical protein